MNHYANYCGPLALENFLKSKRSKTNSLVTEKTSYKYFRISLRDRQFSIKTNETMKNWKVKIDFNDLISYSPKVNKEDADLCDYPYGFQLHSLLKRYVLFCKDEETHFNWVRLLEYHFNKKDLGKKEVYRQKFKIEPQQKIRVFNPSRSPSLINVEREGVNQEENPFKKMRNETKHSTAKSNVILNQNDIKGDFSLPHGIPKKNKEEGEEIKHVRSAKKISHIKEDKVDNNKIKNFYKNDPEFLPNLSSKMDNIDFDKLLLDEGMDPMKTVSSPRNNLQDVTSQRPLTKKNTEYLQQVTQAGNKPVDLQKLFYSKSMHIKKDVFNHKFAIENLHCGIDDNNEATIDSNKHVKIGSMPIKTVKQVGFNLQEPQLEIAKVESKKLKKFGLIEQALKNATCDFESEEKKGVLVNKNIVDDGANGWTLNLSIKQNK